MDNNKKSSIIINNFLWSLFERWGDQGVTFIVSIILARLLDPVVYGTVALSNVFTSILGVFIDSGFGSALVQKKDADEKDFSTVFFFNIFICGIAYVIMYFAAPYIAKFYNNLELTNIIRVSSLILIISGFKNILISIIQKNLQYRKFFFASLVGTIGAGIIGIYMAFKGYGVWALVIQGLFNAFVDTVILWLSVKWKPILYFSFERLSALFSFGIKILGTTLIGTIYGKFRELIIGKKYSVEDLAYYNKSFGWPNMLFVNIGGALDSVMFPVMSEAQNDREQVRKIMSQTIRINTFVVFPMLTGLAICAEPAISIILTDKWLPMLEYMRIFCFVSACSAIGNTQINMIRSIGRSDLFLKVDVEKKVIDLIALLITMNISVKAMAISLIVTNIIGIIINMVYVEKLLDFSIKEQINDFLTNILLCIVMAIPVLVVSLYIKNDIIKLLIEIPVGAIVYFIVAKLFKFDSFNQIIGLLKK